MSPISDTDFCAGLSRVNRVLAPTQSAQRRRLWSVAFICAVLSGCQTREPTAAKRIQVVDAKDLGLPADAFAVLCARNRGVECRRSMMSAFVVGHICQMAMPDAGLVQCLSLCRTTARGLTLETDEKVWQLVGMPSPWPKE
jgi:hypothetical protein